MKEIDILAEQIERIQTFLFHYGKVYEKFCNTYPRLLEDVKNLKQRLKVFEECLSFLSNFATEAKEKVSEKVEPFLNSIVNKIFENHKVRLKMEKLNYCGVYVENPSKYEIPIELCGGGLRDVIAVLFFILVNLLSKSKIIVLDESFSNLSKDRSSLFLQFLKELANRYQIQIILVSHDPNVKTDVVDQIIQL